MIDIQQLKTTVDLRVLAEQELGRPVSRGNRAWTFKCPFHAESKGASLSVYQDGWKCWGACQESGDLLTWVAKRHQLNIHQPADFAEVVRLLGGSPDVLQRRTFHHRVTTKASTVSEPTEPPSAAWQGAASDIVERAERNLWSRAGQAA